MCFSSSGHIVSVELATGATYIWNALCSDHQSLLNTSDVGGSDYCPHSQSGIWSRAGVVVEPLDESVYIVTGNGHFDGKVNWADSIIKMRAGLVGGNAGMLDTYTPDNYQYLGDNVRLFTFLI